jgi:hypothetical protein
MAGLSVGCGKKKSEKSRSDYGFRAGIIFYVISYDTPPLVSGAVNSANAAKNFFFCR